MPGHVLCGLHSDVCQAGLGDDVWVQAADSHQAAQVAALIVGLVVLVETHLGGRPALQVARAVDGAEALAIGCNERGGSGGRDAVLEDWDYLSGVPYTCCGDDGRFLQFSEPNMKGI